MRKTVLLSAGLFALLLSGSAPTEPIRPGNPEWPVAWTSYRRVVTTETDFADLNAHGVGLVETGTGNVERAKEQPAVARRFHMKYAISLPEITESAGVVRQQGLTPVDALMIGGVYHGQAIDRHLFHFSAAPQRIAIEPPVYDPASFRPDRARHRGNTFPKARPESWERAAAFHRRLMAGPPPKPVAKLAVLRGYVPWRFPAWSMARFAIPRIGCSSKCSRSGRSNMGNRTMSTSCRPRCRQPKWPGSPAICGVIRT